MNLQALIGQVTALARTAAAVIPGEQLVGSAIGIGEKIIEVIDDLKQHVPADDTALLHDMNVARGELAKAVSAKADATSSRLRG
jgi:hypothetical protein